MKDLVPPITTWLPDMGHWSKKTSILKIEHNINELIFKETFKNFLLVVRIFTSICNSWLQKPAWGRKLCLGVDSPYLLLKTLMENLGGSREEPGVSGGKA